MTNENFWNMIGTAFSGFAFLEFGVLMAEVTLGLIL
jgi:hypothetical protein